MVSARLEPLSIFPRVKYRFTFTKSWVLRKGRVREKSVFISAVAILRRILQIVNIMLNNLTLDFSQFTLNYSRIPAKRIKGIRRKERTRTIQSMQLSNYHKDLHTKIQTQYCNFNDTRRDIYPKCKSLCRFCRMQLAVEAKAVVEAEDAVEAEVIGEAAAAVEAEQVEHS